MLTHPGVAVVVTFVFSVEFSILYIILWYFTSIFPGRNEVTTKMNNKPVYYCIHMKYKCCEKLFHLLLVYLIQNCYRSLNGANTKYKLEMMIAFVEAKH